MKKLLGWMMALVLALTAPIFTSTAGAEETAATSTTDTTASGTTGTTGTTNSTSTGTTDTTAVPSSTVQTDTQTSEDGEDAEVDDDKDDDKKKEKKHKKHENKYKGIEKALESLLKNLEDAKGTASDEALKAVIEKLKSKLKEDGTASTDDEAEDAVEEKLQTDVEDGTATEQDVEILVTIKVKGKKAKEAQDNVETVLSKNPNSDKLYGLLSKVLQEQGDTEKVKVYVKGKKPVMDVQPYEKDGRNLVPVRAISEALGAKVSWNQDSETVIIEKDGVKIELPLSSKTIKVNGEEKTIDAAAELKNDRIMVPVRFISEFLGQKVDWDAKTKMVIVK